MKADVEGTAETPEELIAHISRLMDEAESMLVGPATGQPGKFEEIESKLESVRSKLARFCGDARRKIVAGARCTDEAIRAHPYRSLAIALGAGVLIGACFFRRKE